MRVVLKECAWEPLGDELILVSDPREALTLNDPDGTVAALLGELSNGPSTVIELSRALSARGIALTEDEVAGGLDGLDSLGLLERSDQRSLGDPAVDERHFSNLSFFTPSPPGTGRGPSSSVGCARRAFWSSGSVAAARASCSASPDLASAR